MSEMKGQICVVTGSNSGIGKETAVSLAAMGATVVMVVRDQERGEKARSEIVKQTRNNSVDLMFCDLSSMDSIRHFANEFKKRYDRGPGQHREKDQLRVASQANGTEYTSITSCFTWVAR